MKRERPRIRPLARSPSLYWLSERVGADDLAAGTSAEGPPGVNPHRVLHEPDRTVGHGDVDATGMQAPRRQVGPGKVIGRRAVGEGAAVVILRVGCQGVSVERRRAEGAVVLL